MVGLNALLIQDQHKDPTKPTNIGTMIKFFFGTFTVLGNLIVTITCFSSTPSVILGYSTAGPSAAKEVTRFCRKYFIISAVAFLAFTLGYGMVFFGVQCVLGNSPQGSLDDRIGDFIFYENVGLCFAIYVLPNPFVSCWIYSSGMYLSCIEVQKSNIRHFVEQVHLAIEDGELSFEEVSQLKRNYCMLSAALDLACRKSRPGFLAALTAYAGMMILSALQLIKMEASEGTNADAGQLLNLTTNTAVGVFLLVVFLYSMAIVTEQHADLVKYLRLIINTHTRGDDDCMASLVECVANENCVWEVGVPISKQLVFQIFYTLATGAVFLFNTLVG